MKIRPIKQPTSSACGPVCIQLTAKYFGLDFSFTEITHITGYKPSEGLSNKDIVSGLRRLGLSVRGKKNATWSDLRQLNTKKNIIVVSWMLRGCIGHVSLINKVAKNHIFLADTEEGKILKLPKLVFLRQWMDYDDMWFPLKNTDIQLRWMAVVSKKRKGNDQ